MSSKDTYSYDSRLGEQIGETADGQPVVAEAGDGSLPSGEALKDVNRPENRHAARGQQRTTFHADDADNGEKYRRLWKHQHGYHNDDTGQRATDDKVRVAEALADALHLPDARKDDVKNLVQKCDGRAFNRLGGLEAVALGCIAVVDNQRIDTEKQFENRIQVRYLSDEDGERIYSHDLPRFKHLAEKHGVDWRKAKRKVREQISGR